MTSQLAAALSEVEHAAREIFGADGRVRSVGVGKVAGGYAFVAVRNIRAPVALAARVGAGLPPVDYAGIPILYEDTAMDPIHLARFPLGGSAASDSTAAIPEWQSHRPLTCGLEIQNYDHDVRSGEIAKGYITIGTLGCFVKLAGGKVALLSNNHVVAGQNGGQNGSDRILQPGGADLTIAPYIATLSHFVALRPSAPDASIADGTVTLNDVDAGVAMLAPGIGYQQSYLADGLAAAPAGVAIAAVGDKVHKVGRTTGLTLGTVTQVGTVVGPVSYTPGNCWFRQSFVVESDNGIVFSDHGDSGSAIVRDDGKVLGLLYAGNGTQTYACGIANVFNALDCQLA